MKKFLILLLLPFFLWGAVRTVYWATDGFFIWNIKSHLATPARWDLKEPDEDRKSLIAEVLKQKFSYFAKGHQAYVFLSEDGEWVIKFPKFQRYREWPVLKDVPLPQGLDHQRRKMAEIKHKELSWILDSWKITYQEYPTLACLLYVQINPSPYFEGHLTLIDSLGIRYTLPISDCTFMIQRRAEVFDQMIKRQYSADNLEPAQKTIKDLISLYKDEFKMGVFEKDQHIMRNMGYCDGRMMHIDPARFVKVATHADQEYFNREIIYKTVKLKNWLSKKYPALLPTLEQELFN